MTVAAPSTPGPIPPPPRRNSHGCLWGCLAASLIAIVVIGGGLGYFGWYFYSGFKSDATLKNVMDVVASDQIARAILGDDITVTNLESSSVNADLESKTNRYVAHLKGTRGEGTLSATVITPHGGKPTITGLLLVGPDGHQYNLLTGGDFNQNAVPGPTNIDHKTNGDQDNEGDTGQTESQNRGSANGDDGQTQSGNDNDHNQDGDVGQDGGPHDDQGDDGGQDTGNQGHNTGDQSI